MGTLLQQKLQIANMQFGAKTHARRLLLEEALNNSVNTITQPKVHAYWEHMLSLIPLMIAKENV